MSRTAIPEIGPVSISVRDLAMSPEAVALQRIADAVEKVAESYDNMRASRDYWQQRTGEEAARAERLARQVRALKGTITRMKRKGVQG